MVLRLVLALLCAIHVVDALNCTDDTGICEMSIALPPPIMPYQQVHGLFLDTDVDSLVIAYQDGLAVLDHVTTTFPRSPVRSAFWSLTNPWYSTASFLCPKGVLLVWPDGQGVNTVLAVQTRAGSGFSVVANFSVHGEQSYVITHTFPGPTASTVWFADFYWNMTFLIDCTTLSMTKAVSFDFQAMGNMLEFEQLHDYAETLDGSQLLIPPALQSTPNEVHFTMVRKSDFGVAKRVGPIAFVPPYGDPRFAFWGFSSMAFANNGNLVATYGISDVNTGASGPTYVAVLDGSTFAVLNPGVLLNHVNPTEYIIWFPFVRRCVSGSGMWLLLSAFNHGFSSETTYARIQVVADDGTLGPTYNDTAVSTPSQSLGYAGMYAFGSPQSMWAAGSYQPTSFLTQYAFKC